MKKFLSIVLSLVMLLSVSVATVNAFAIVGSIESTTKVPVVPRGTVNGQTSDDVTYKPDPSDPRKVTITYIGDGELIGWEFPGMIEGTDYTIISEKGNSITIVVADSYTGEVVANAIVREKTTAKTTKKKSSKTTTSKNKSETSPKTGAVTGAAGFAAMGAGAAILTALKKKEDAE